MSLNKSSSSATAVDEQKSQLLQQEYNKSQQLIQQLESQSGTLASQLQEHIIVDQTLSSIPPEERQVGKRKCYKMIGGVLVEKSIDDVIKILHDEKNQLIKLKKEVDDELEKSRKKLESWISSNKIKIVKGWEQKGEGKWKGNNKNARKKERKKELNKASSSPESTALKDSYLV